MKLCVTDEGQINYYKLLYFSSDSHTYTQFIFYIPPNSRVRQNRKRVESTSLSTLFHRLIQRCNRLFQLCEVLAQLFGLFALGCNNLLGCLSTNFGLFSFFITKSMSASTLLFSLPRRARSASKSMRSPIGI